MKYLGKMTVKMMESNDFIDAEDKADLKRSFDESFENLKNSENRLAKLGLAVLSNPIGAWFFIWVYSRINRNLADMNRQDSSDGLESQFEDQFKERIYRKILDKQEENL